MLWMDCHNHQYAFNGRTGVLDNTLIVEDCPTLLFPCSSSYISTFYAQCHTITRRRNNSIKRQVDSFSKKTPLLHAYMGHAACHGVKYDMNEGTIFTINAKYFPAKMKFQHFGDKGSFNHRP